MLISAVIALLRAGEADHGWLRAPIALYAGWLTAASSVALGLMLAGHGILSAQMAAYAGIALALAVALAVQALRPDTLAYPAAVIWALVGVGVSNLAGPNWSVLVLVALGIGVIGWRAAVNLRA